MALVMLEGARGFYLGEIALFEAMLAGDPVRLAFGLHVACWIAGMSAVGRGRVPEWVRLQRQIAAKHGDDRLLGCAALSAGIAEFCNGRWSEARRSCDDAEQRLRGLSGVTAELHNARAFGTWSLFYLGEARALSERVPALAREARSRGNLWALNSVVCAFGPVAWLAHDDPDAASREVEEAFSEWPVTAFQVQHYWNLLARGLIDLYLGEGVRLEARMEESWRGLWASSVLFANICRQQMVHLRASGALLAAEAEERGRAERLARAERYARGLARNPVIGSRALAEHVRGGIARVRGDRERSARHLDLAVAELAAADMRLFAAAARRALGRIEGGSSGEALVAGAEEEMRAAGIARPDRFAAMLAPGLGG
jgi:hypothetical protein